MIEPPQLTADEIAHIQPLHGEIVVRIVPWGKIKSGLAASTGTPLELPQRSRKKIRDNDRVAVIVAVGNGIRSPRIRIGRECWYVRASATQMRKGGLPERAKNFRDEAGHEYISIPESNVMAVRCDDE